MLKIGINPKTQNSKNIESSLWKKVPNSIDLTEIYKGKNSLLLNFSPNKNKILPQLNNKKHEDKIIAIRQIFLKFSGCLSFEGQIINRQVHKKHKYYLIHLKS